MDFKTLVIAALVVSLATNLSMAIVFWTRRTYAGFGYWLVGTCFRTLAALPFLLPRDQYPPWLTIVLPNFLMLAELLFYLRGTLIFRGRTVRIGWEIAASLSFIALFVWFTYLRPDYGARLLVISLYHATIEIWILHTLLTRRPPYFGSIDRWQAGIWGLLATAVLARIAFLWMGAPPTPEFVMTPVYLNQWVLILILSQLLIALSFILMNAQRLEYDYRQTQRQLEEDIRRRQEAEKRLRISEERHRLLADNARDTIWTMAADGTITYVSPAVEKVRGYTPDEAMRQTLDEIHPPGSKAISLDYFARLQAAVQTGRPPESFLGELEYRCKDGSTLWTEVRAYPITAPDGAFVELVGVTRDVSERKRYEDALRNSERRLRLLLDSFSQIAVQGFTPGGTITFWNQANEPLYGYTAAEALGQDLVELIIPPEQRPAFREIIHQMASTGVRSPASEYSVRRKDGKRVTVYANYAIIDVPGSGRELYCIDIDLTGLRQAEEQLRISEERHRLLADHAMDVIWTMGLDGTFNYMSPSIIGLRGYTAEEVQHMPLEATFTPASWAIVQAGLATARANVQAGLPVDFRAELEELRKDGSIVWTDVRATGIYGSDGRFIELVGVTRDISERKRYERELEAARAAAEAAARARSEFLANMSHEIRTPMNGVLGLAQLLEREPLTPDQRAMVRRLRGAGRTLIGIINDILDFSKIEAGQLQIDRHPFALAPLLERLEGLLGDTARGKGVALRFAAPTGLAGGLVGDDLRLEQALLNLVGNAIKFTAAGEVRVQVEAHDLTATAVRLQFEVHDSGVGIAPEVLPTLFTPFVQADGSITRRFGGTGLGLSITQRLVELMGGTLGAESTPGQGSCFWFELPFARTTDLALPGTHGAPDPAATGPRLTGRRLLVVDDSDINREVVARIVQQEGAEAFLANDGEQALAALRAHPGAYDAVLMDVQMPVMDGLTATRRVRDELGLTTLPVIAFTAGVLAEERQRALGAGVNDFLAKPVDLEALVAIIRRWTTPPDPAADGLSADPSGPAPGTGVGPTASGRPHLDTAAGLEMLGGNERLYRRVLASFVEAYAERRLDGEGPEARRMAHTLKGLSGNLGATRLRALASELEQGWDADRVAALNLELAQVVTEIRQWLQRSGAVEPSRG